MATFPLPAGGTYYATIWGASGTRWNGTAMAATSTIADASWSTGLVTLVELLTSNSTHTGQYTFTAPAALPAGWYRLSAHGVNTVESEELALATMKFCWNGTSEVEELPSVAAGAAGGVPVLDASANLLAYLRGFSPNGVDTAIGAEGAAGRMAANWLTFINAATQNLTGASVNQTADCNAAATWQRHARVANDCVGTVWYVAIAANGGNDANDGLTPWTPKLTIKTVVDAATAGDVVLIGPGTFTEAGASRVLHPAGVIVRGAGIDSTTVIGSGPFMIFWRPSSNCRLENLTINTRASTTCAPWGVVTSDAAATNAVLNNVRLIGESDGLYLSCTSACSVLAYNSAFSGRWDSVACDGAAHTVDIYDTEIDGQGPSATAVETNAIRCSQGTVTLWGCKVSARLGRTGYGTNGIYATGSGNVTMHGGSLFVYDANNAGLSIKNASTGRIEMDGVEYDTTKTSNTGGGTISDVPSHSLDSNGLTIQAAANAALVANNLDHFAFAPTASDDMTAEVADNTIFSRILAGGNTSDFVSATMSMKKIAADAASVLAKFTGITLIANWLGLLAGKTADAATLAEVNATTAGATFNNTTDSLEAIATNTLAIDNLTKAGGDGDLAEILSIVSSVSLGDGARAVTLTVTDGTNALENARVRVTSGSTSLVGDTNASGVIVFGLDDATWSVTITKSGYSFTPTTLAVSADTSHTYAMTAVTIPASDPNFVTGYLYCYDENGDVEESVIIQMKIVSLSGSGSGYDTAIRSETSDATGLVTFTNLVPGALYSIRRGTETDWVDITISAAATDPYEMDNLFGEDS